MLTFSQLLPVVTASGRGKGPPNHSCKARLKGSGGQREVALPPGYRCGKGHEGHSAKLPVRGVARPLSCRGASATSCPRGTGLALADVSPARCCPFPW